MEITVETVDTIETVDKDIQDLKQGISKLKSIGLKDNGPETKEATRWLRNLMDNCQGVTKEYSQNIFSIPMPPDQEDVPSK